MLGIMAILAALLLPAITKSRRHANLVTCTSNLRQFGLAFSDWSREHGDKFPDSGQWIPVVVAAAPGGAERILACPEGSPGDGNPVSSVASDLLASFWSNKHPGHTPNGSRNNGRAPWRSRVTSADADHFTAAWTFKPQSGNHEIDDLVIEGQRLNDNIWRATIIQPNPYPAKERYDVAVLSTGQRYSDVSSLTPPFTFTATSGSLASHYGFNFLAGNVIDRRSDAVIVMDYDKTVVDCVNDEPTVFSQFMPPDRHMRQVNVLFADGSVRRVPLADLTQASTLFDAEPGATHVVPADSGKKRDPKK